MPSLNLQLINTGAGNYQLMEVVWILNEQFVVRVETDF